MRRVTIVTLCFAALGSLALDAHAQRGSEVRIAVLVDSPSERNRTFYDTFNREITDLLSLDYQVTFVTGAPIAADGTLGTIRENAERILADPDVDVVLSGGPITSAYLARRGELPKPVIALSVLNAQAQGFPFANGASGEPNLNYITFTLDLAGSIEVFLEVVPFRHLALLISEGTAEVAPQIGETVEPWFAEQGVAIDVVPVGTSAEESLERLPPETDAVMVGTMGHLDNDAFARLVDGLIQRGLPSFSLVGESDVRAGLLLTTYRDADISRLARRTALNLQSILEGVDAGTLSVSFSRNESLIINRETARALGVSPNWAILTEAEVIEPVRTTAPALTLDEAVERAVEANLELLAAAYGAAASLEAVGESRAPLLPQVDVSLVGRVIDADRARAGFGSSPQYSFLASLGLDQLIYSEEAWAGLEISEHLALSDAEARQQIRLDIVAETAITYLNVLRARTVERIQRENLALTRTNLELARVRESVGFSGPSDVYRFESAIAQNRQAVIEANAQRNLAEITLNRLMHRSAEESFQPEEPLEYRIDPRFDSPLRPYLDNPASFRIFREFMVQEALQNSPELRRLDALIAARERELSAVGRSYFIPTVALSGDLNTFQGWGEGSDFGLSIPGVPSAEGPDDINWTLQLVASLPLFTGLRRQSAERRIDQDLAELTTQRAAVAERIEEATRQTLHLAGASAAGIGLALDAAEAARNNLELVMDAYARGVASIPELIDAQTSERVAAEQAANAVFNYQIDLTRVERAIGSFEWEMTEDERAAFYERVQAYFEAAEP